MKLFNVVIVEDEKSVLDLMQYVVGQNQNYNIVGAFSNPLEALASLPELRADVVFLDVEMPKMNGLELAQKINEMTDQTKIVFTTAYKEYALDAFKVYAFDYILKPVTPMEIERIMNRLLKQRPPVVRVEQPRRQSTIRCFGGFEVRNPEGALVRWPTRKTEELFAFFLCHPGRDISKWRLSDFLWSEMDEDRATHNLHNTIYRLKKMLKGHEIGMDIRKTIDGYLLDTADQTYDVLAFQQHDFSSANGVGDVARAEQLCAQYAGPLLERKDYLWKAPLEEQFRKQYTSLVRNLTRQDFAAQEWAKAERRLEAYLTAYPLHEEMNLALLQVYSHSGNKESFAKQYARFEAAYRQELGLAPPAEMKSQADSFLNNR
ncbi:response regulator [Tumebacillus lipolyticus]|uniref:Response regulator n=1 Tax=Tumebacillus lipolyticus TaxID=1280370 RepID=A0ABW4ZXG3_9BACL